METKNKLLALVFMLSPVLLLAQEDPNKGNFKFVSVKLHSGKHYYTGTALKDKLKNGYTSIEIRAGWQTKGKFQWEKEHGYPSYGIGTYNGYVQQTGCTKNSNTGS